MAYQDVRSFYEEPDDDLPAHGRQRLHCPRCGGFLTSQPTTTIACLPGHAYEWPEVGPPIVTEIPPAPPTSFWTCSRCGKTTNVEEL